MSEQYTPQNCQGQNKGKSENLLQPKWQLNVSAGRKKTKEKIVTISMLDLYCFCTKLPHNTLKQKKTYWNFPDIPVAKTSPFHAGGAGLIPGWELRSHMSHSQKTKTENRSDTIANSVKTLKMIHTPQKKLPLSQFCTSEV